LIPTKTAPPMIRSLAPARIREILPQSLLAENLFLMERIAMP